MKFPKNKSLTRKPSKHRAEYKFLPSGNGVPKEEIIQVGIIQLSKKECNATAPVIDNIRYLTKTGLRKKYKLEASRHSNMKERCKKKGFHLDPMFKEFPCFLALMGAIPDKSYTLDRINNDDKTYSPANCRWADKFTQNSNKSNNVFLTHQGESRTIAQWAKSTNQNATTLYKRHKSGWTDKEIITGIKQDVDSSIYTNTCWCKQKRKAWEKTYQDYVANKNEQISRVKFFYLKSDKLLKEVAGLWEIHYDCNFPFDEKAVHKAGVLYHREIKYKAFRNLAKKYVLYEEKRERYLARFSRSNTTEKARFTKCNPPPC